MAYFRDLVRCRPHPKFWAKTFAHLLTPGGYGYIRNLRAGKDASYVHDRDKHPVRHKHHGGGGWKEGTEEGLRRRDYADYDEYLTHQKLKLEELVKMKGGFSNFDIFDYRVKFYTRFRHLPGFLPPSADILCCGARQGTEVDVLQGDPSKAHQQLGWRHRIEFPELVRDMVLMDMETVAREKRGDIE